MNCIALNHSLSSLINNFNQVEMPSLKKKNIFSRSRSKERNSNKTKHSKLPPVVIKSHNSNCESELPPGGIFLTNHFSKKYHRNADQATRATKSLPSESIREGGEVRSIIHLPRPTSVPRNLLSSRSDTRWSTLQTADVISASPPYKNSHLSVPLVMKGRPRSYHGSERELNEEDLTCAICLEILHRPRELTCGHAFCLLCLQNYSNSCLSKFTCPSCRQAVTLPSNGVSDLRRNAKLELLTEEFCKKQSQMMNSAQICVKCQSEEDVVECDHCNKGWCQFCCLTHGEEVKKEFFVLKTKLENVKETLKGRKKEEENRYQSLEQKIVDVVELKVMELLDKKEQLSNEICELRLKSQDQIYCQTQEIESILSKLITSQDISWIDAGQHIPIIKKLLKSSDLKSSRISFNNLSLTLNSAEEESSDGTRICVSRKTSSNTVGEDAPELNEDDLEDRILILPNEKGSVYRKKSSYSKHKWGHHICERPAGVAISPWNNFIYVTGSDACKVYIYDQGGKQIGSFGSRGHGDGQFLCPIGVAFSEVNNELYITDKWKHCIHVFDSDGNFIRQLGKKGKGFGQFFSPEGIATDRSGNIFIADTCNDRVQVLDSEGIFLKEVGVISSELVGLGRRYTKREFSEPVGVAVNVDGSRIYVADSGNHRIRVFNSETGERLLMFGSRGKNKGQFESPESVAVDSQGFIIVGDSGNGRIQIFRPNGHFIRFLGVNSKRKGEFGWVSAVTVTDNNDIIATDFKNNSLSLF